MKKYFITMTTKGRLKELCIRSKLREYISFEKTDIKQSEILIIDTDGIEMSGCDIKPINRILGLWGTYTSNPYKYRNELREIKDDDKDGYVKLSISEVDKETEKALHLSNLGVWIPKSLTLKDSNYLYIKRWFIYNNA